MVDKLTLCIHMVRFNIKVCIKYTYQIVTFSYLHYSRRLCLLHICLSSSLASINYATKTAEHLSICLLWGI